MAIRLPIAPAKQSLPRSVSGANKAASRSLDVPKGFLAVTLGKLRRSDLWFPHPI